MSFKPLTSWSFSRYSAYTNCPAQFKYGTLEKRPVTKNPAMQRGADIHDKVSAFLTATKKATMPTELRQFRDLVMEIKASRKKFPGKTVVEDTWAFRKDWSKTVWDDWNGCWVRIKLDAAYHVGDSLYIIDWKTGKFRPERHQEYLEQLELYALGGLLIFPEAKVVEPRLVYLDEGTTHASDTVYSAADRPRLQKGWEKRVAPMFKDQTFKPKPSNLCRYCDFSKSKSGPCAY